MADGERTPPSSEKAERAVLGSIILSATELLPELADLAADDFFFPHHREVWEAIRALEKRGAQVNIIAIEDEVKARGTFARLPFSFLLEVANDGTVPEQAIGHAKTVKKLSTLRQLIRLCVEVQSRAYAVPEVDDVLGDVRAGVAKLEAGASTDNTVKLVDAIDEVMDAIEERARGTNKERLARTGLGGLDHLIGHFKRGHLVFIGGLPGMGKTSLARGFVSHNVRNGIPVVVFPNEENRGQWIEELLSVHSHVPATNISRGRIEFSDWKNRIQPAAKRIVNDPLWINDSTMATNQIVGESHRWFNKHVRRVSQDAKPYGIMVVDQLNLVPDDEKAENRNRAVGSMVRRFKRLARDTDSTVIVVAQLNRSSAKEQREPVMSDFRDCGEIEAFADVIIAPYREGYGKPMTQDREKAIKALGYEEARVLLLKQKGGAYGGIDVAFYRDRMEFADLDGGRFQQETPRHFSEIGEHDE